MWRRLDRSFWSVRIRDQVDEGEDDDPDDVDEVPVQPGYLDIKGLLRWNPAAQGEEEDRQEPGNPDRHVRAVEAGQDEEGGAKDIAFERQTLVGEGGELEELAPDEDCAEERGCRDPDTQPAMIAALYRRQGQHHRQRGHEEHEGADRGVGDVEDLVRVWRRSDRDAAVAVRHVGRDQRSE